MKVDVFAHFVPPKILDLMIKRNYGVAETVKSNLSLYDFDTRFRAMDRHPDVVQVLTFPWASPVEMAGPKEAVDLAKKINDEMAELVLKYPDRFAGAVAVLPTSDIDACLKEIDRAITELCLRGILLRIPIDGKRPVDSPEFLPLYEKMCQYNLPIWWHPQSSPQKADYPGETESKYFIWHLWGLIWETTISMTRLVFSGIMEEFPRLKIITHHCGAMVPYFAERIVNHHKQQALLSKTKFTIGLTESPIEYFRRFYNDTAIVGNTPALMCAHSFFGADHLLFGTDAPFDTQLGVYCTNRTIEAIERMDIPSVEKKKIFEENARTLMRLLV